MTGRHDKECVFHMDEAAVSREQLALAKIDEEWVSAVRDGDIERALSFWSDDAVVLPPGAPPVVGKDAIRAFVTASFRIPDFAISWITDRWTVARACDMAYGVGSNTTTFRDRSGSLVTIVGKSATVWRNGPDGWKCVLDVWNDSQR